MAYGVSFNAMYRRAADYVDRILQGTKPADLPVEQPRRFEFVINLRPPRLWAHAAAVDPLPGGRGDQVEARAGARRGVVNEGAGSREREHPFAAHGRSQPNQAWSGRATRQAFSHVGVGGVWPAAHRGR